MEDIYAKLAEALKTNQRFVLATIVKQAGPSPRGIGTKCLIMEDGSLRGTIGGGRLEARTLEEAKKVLREALPKRLNFFLKGRDVAETEMLCGGEVEIFLEPVFPNDKTYLSIIKGVMNARKRGGSGLLATLLNLDKWGEREIPKMFIDKNGKKTGSLARTRQIENTVQDKMPEILRSNQPQAFAFHTEGGQLIEVYVEPVLSRPRLYVFGGGHVSREIVPLASRVGFHVVVVDDRKEFADPAQFPSAEEVRHLSFERVMERLPVSASSFVVIVTRGHIYDKDILAQALKTNAGYIGMIGSRRKRNIIYKKLLKEGFTESDLKRVHSPIGVDIGAESPAEIAVSIVAELIKERAEHVG